MQSEESDRKRVFRTHGSRLLQHFRKTPMSDPYDYQGPSAPPPPEYSPQAPVVVIPRPVATWVLAGILVVVYILTALGALLQGSDPFTLDPNLLAAYGGLLGDPVMHGQYWRLLSYAFLHGGVWHVAMNTFALINIGPLVEAWEGRARFIAFFLVTAVTSGLVALYFDPGIVTIGASGGLFGLLGAIIAVLIRYGHHLPERVRSSLWSSMGRILVINLVISLMPHVSWAGHLGGFVGGVLLGLIIAVPPGQSLRRQPQNQGWQ